MGNVFYRSPEHDYPIAVRGEGVYLYDQKGKRYLDASGGAAVSCLGHGHPMVVDAIKKQVEQMAYAHTAFFTNEPQEQLANRLADRFPAKGHESIFCQADPRPTKRRSSWLGSTGWPKASQTSMSSLVAIRVTTAIRWAHCRCPAIPDDARFTRQFCMTGQGSIPATPFVIRLTMRPTKSTARGQRTHSKKRSQNTARIILQRSLPKRWLVRRLASCLLSAGYFQQNSRNLRRTRHPA